MKSEIIYVMANLILAIDLIGGSHPLIHSEGNGFHLAIELKENLVERTHIERQTGKSDREVCGEDKGALIERIRRDTRQSTGPYMIK